MQFAARMGFGPRLHASLRFALAPSRAAVAANGRLSAWLSVEGGLPPGGALSCLVWVLQLQPLSARLHATGTLRTPLPLPGAALGSAR